MRVHELVGTKLLSAATTQLLAYCLLITKQVELLAPARVEVPLARMQLSQVQQGGRPPVVEDIGAHNDPRTAGNSPFPAMQAPAPAPKAASEPKLPAQLEQRKADVVARHKSIKGEDYFQMLGVAQEAPSEQIQQAFLGLAKTWHPDRLPAAIADVRDACATVFSHMSEAHQTLMDPKRREEYMHLLKDGGATPEEQAQVQAVLEAATNFQKAEFFLRRGDMKEAEVLCRKAHDGDPTPAEYLAMLAWLEAMKPENQEPQPTRERIAMLDRAIATNSRLERAYFYRGMLYKRLANQHAAVRDFREAAALNPRNLDAVREVRLYEMRKSRGSIPPSPGAGDDKGDKRRQSNRPAPSSQRSPAPNRAESLFGKLFKK